MARRISAARCSSWVTSSLRSMPFSLAMRSNWAILSSSSASGRSNSSSKRLAMLGRLFVASGSRPRALVGGPVKPQEAHELLLEAQTVADHVDQAVGQQRLGHLEVRGGLLANRLL